MKFDGSSGLNIHTSLSKHNIYKLNMHQDITAWQRLAKLAMQINACSFVIVRTMWCILGFKSYRLYEMGSM